VKEGQEVCDGGSASCASLGQGFVSGTAPCKQDCTGYDTKACTGGSNAPADLTPAEARKQISLERYKQFVTTLASAELQGRKFGQPGGLKAVEYIAAKFKEAGILPGPSNEYRLSVSGGKGYNTIGVLPGNDPALKQKVVLVGGHHDHLGNSGCLYAGADDNASGASAVMELAFVMTKLRNTLKRTVVFMTFDGEEAGCVGSSAYVKSPVYPLADTVVMLNFDMIGHRGSYAEYDAWSRVSADGTTHEVYGGVTPDALASMQKGEPGGTYCSLDSDIFEGKGVKTQVWCTCCDSTCCDSTYHTCSDTVDRMKWDGALGAIGQGFDALWKAAQN